MPKVSVIIPSYNCADYLPQAIDSVLNQTYQDFEIVVINDGSSDNTQMVIDSYVSKYPDKVRCITQENQGLACARNTGIENARGEYLALLDADDIWLSQRLEHGVKVLDSQPDVALVHANIVWMTESGELQSEAQRNPKIFSDNILKDLYLRELHISCPTVLFRKQCTSEVGMFDEKLARLGCEDRDLWVRIATRYKVKYIPRSLAYYRIRKSGMSKDNSKMLDARRYVIEKNASSNPVLTKYKSEALAHMYRDFADTLLKQSKFVAARKQYWLSLKNYPFGFWPWINLAKTFIPKVR